MLIRSRSLVLLGLAQLGWVACSPGLEPIAEPPLPAAVSSTARNVTSAAAPKATDRLLDSRCAGSRPTSDALQDDWSASQEGTSTAGTVTAVPGLTRLGTKYKWSEDGETLLAVNGRQVFWLDAHLALLGVVSGKLINGAVASGDSLVVYAADGERWFSRRDGFRRVASRRIEARAAEDLRLTHGPELLAPGVYAFAGVTPDRVLYATTGREKQEWLGRYSDPGGESISGDGRLFLLKKQGYAVLDLCGDHPPMAGAAPWEASDLDEVVGFADGRALVRHSVGFSLVDTIAADVHRVPSGDSPTLSEDGSLVAFQEAHHGDVVVLDVASKETIARFAGDFPEGLSKRTRRVVMSDSQSNPTVREF